MQRFDEGDQLPALWFGEFGPDGHAAADDAIGDQPEKRAGRGGLDRFFEQAGAFAGAFGGVAVALAAVLVEKVASGSDGIGIGCHWIVLDASFFGGFGEFGVNQTVFFKFVLRFFLRRCGLGTSGENT